MDAGGLWGGVFEVQALDARGGDGAAVVEEEDEAHAAGDEAGFEIALYVDGASEDGGDRRGAVVGVAGDTDGVTAEVFDVVIAVGRFYVEDGAGRQIF